MFLRPFSILITLCLGLGFLSLPRPVQSLPLNAIAQVNVASTALDFFNQGVKRLQQGDLEAAINSFNEAIRLNPNYAQAYGNRGIAYSRLQQYDKALADYNQFIRFNPNSAAAYYNRATLYDKLGDSQKAIADYDQAIRLNPNFTQAISGREMAQNKLRTPQQSISNTNALAQYFSNPTTAENFFVQAMDKYDKADFDGAIVDFSQAIQLKPDYAPAYMGRAMAYKGLGDLENQITELRKAAELLQKQGDTEAYQTTIDLIKVTQDLIDSIRSNPNSKLAFAELFFNYGIEEWKKGNFVQSLAQFNLVIRLNPNDASAYLFRGNAYGQLKEYQKAIADYTQAIRLDPNYADAYNLRGLVYGMSGNRQKAIADLQKAANLYQQQGDTAQAQKVLDLLKELQP
ncbi:MAG: tetratricopeptide repeat protein [Microcystis wesenbergii Mw_QC_S_20081001_S30D]|jgi:tetratricopeptide (TPR) repeat protein|uniref:Tetratricopeptide repeat protein n=1 Tax=Microcystis wesenbergii Mw_QC_S_20081001_S30D TaxID=2486245 RepID=A0A552JFU1_9CHRO|nr:MAG: tetratricopeptide repeat protein [Microcystis wesenbergii Mw_QC_S_20081001_S30D]TRU98935.1 MAG: tetratricopeptide repeat protein [Microcystis wesenbergii Mw_QC_B_20070930_S4D]TRV01261.1 MAG: tetratricopeptide repeat protein [Microcystis wesenbergii Mw_QC_S_20081001_S30]TRV11443.1 MAG: tetratricopeptide repeat protein [Microcystis wesenbergii Mw_QC_B_20070930_S4]